MSRTTCSCPKFHLPVSSSIHKDDGCLGGLGKSGFLSWFLPWKERVEGWLSKWAKWRYSTRSGKLGTFRKRKALIAYAHPYFCGRIETEECYKKATHKGNQRQRKTGSPTPPGHRTTNGACSRKVQDKQSWERQLARNCPLKAMAVTAQCFPQLTNPLLSWEWFPFLINCAYCYFSLYI